MGYLTETSQTLTYEESKILLEYIRKHGIIQFLHLFKKFKTFSQSQTFWGDEVELHLLHIDPITKLPKLQLNNDYLFNSITPEDSFVLQPECGGWMVEAVPSKPYETDGDPLPLLLSLKHRREKIKALCKDGDVLFAGTVFPMFQVGDYYVPRVKVCSTTATTDSMSNVSNGQQEDSDSSQTLDSSFNSTTEPRQCLISPHPRYTTLCENIRQRRSEEICILVPLYQDENTNMTQCPPDESYPGYIHMTDTLFGMGDTSMQFTFGTRNIEEARYLTDQMHVFSSIILPLSASTAVIKGRLADVDARWGLLCPSVDCRTPEERDPNNTCYVPKSRWATLSRYISNRPQCKEAYNDIYFPLDKDMMQFAEQQAKELDVELDEMLVKHIGFLFVREPLAVFANKVYVDDSSMTNHFENIQSTNWNNVRFKPPPSFDSQVGWRVELRTGEAQLTAEEGVALGMFSYFFAEMVMKKQFNFYIPISKVDENIARGQKRDAILKEKFWFRRDIRKDSADEWVELTMDEILHGKQDVFVGLMNLIYAFCKEQYGVDIQAEWARKQEDSEIQVNKLAENMKYFEILSKRVRGEMPTTARWMRDFVMKHPEYKKDSIVSGKIAADLVSAMLAISDGEKTYKDFYNV